jgi:hypothetical protein
MRSQYVRLAMHQNQWGKGSQLHQKGCLNTEPRMVKLHIDSKNLK